jgi:hypothetical protein
MKTSDKIPSTFEEYAEHLGITTDHPRRDMARKLWEQEREAERTYPAEIPPCPGWCRLNAGHPYDSTEWDYVTHCRFHSSVPDDTAFDARVEATERNKDGVVEVGTPVLAVYAEGERTAEDARRIAAELLAAADLLDRINGATRSCPRSAAHEPHSWASMVPGQHWSCPGVDAADEVTR